MKDTLEAEFRVRKCRRILLRILIVRKFHLARSEKQFNLDGMRAEFSLVNSNYVLHNLFDRINFFIR